MLIDFHVHMFPDAIAARTIDKLQRVSGFIPLTDGTQAASRALLRQNGCDLGVVMPIATNAHQQRSVNDWVKSIQGDGLVCFGSVYPTAQDTLDELAYIKSIGLHGVKLHPDYQNFFVDDPAVYSVYECMQELELPLMFHAGVDPLSPNLVHSRPAAIARVARDFPQLTVIAAHMGGFSEFEEAMRCVLSAGLENLYIDVSMSMLLQPPEVIRACILRHGAERVLFATDMPWSDGRATAEMIRGMGLSQREEELIFYRNALRILGMEDVKIP